MMFTQTQGYELIDNTNSEWITLNNVNGRKFTSKTDSSKYIFLPAGGEWWNTNHSYVGSWGSYWSTMFHGSGLGVHMYFTSSSVHWEGTYGRLGFSIRSVRQW